MKPKVVISSTSNPQIKNLVLLQKKAKAREEMGLFVVEGIKMFEEAKTAGLLKKAYASESFYQEKVREKPDFFSDMEYEVLTDALLKEVSDTLTPQGILGTVGVTSYPLEDMLTQEKACLLLLEDIRDPGNLGTMLRTAEGAGITGVIFNSSTVDIYNPKVIRSTMGSIFRVPYYRATDFYDTLDRVKEHGIQIFAAHLHGISYDTENCFKKSCGILIGNEANGLTDRASQAADTLIRIPMEGKVESLNAAVAAAILMYEAARQRRS